MGEAYRRVERGVPLLGGLHIHVLPGTLGEGEMPNYWESWWGSADAPVVIEAAEGKGTATLGAVNMIDMR